MKTIKIDNKTARGLTITVGMPDEEYRAIPALSAHGTHDLLTKPMHWARGEQEDTEAMKFGRAFHFMVLECCSGTVFDENKFFEKFAVAPEVNARTKDGKAALEEFKAECEKNGKEALKSQDFDLLNAMRTRVFASKSAITGLGKNDKNTLYEAVLEWDYIEDDEFPKDCSWCWALDVGFKDQTAFGRIGIKEGCIYIDEYIYESGLSVATPVEAPGKDSLVKRLQAIGVKRGDVIIYDSASASTGDTLITCGYNAIPCRKEGGGKTSIVPQIAEMKNYHIRTTRRSIGWIGEVAEYAWNKKEPDGKPIGTNGDHSIDMSRYGATYLILSGGRSRKTQGGRTARRFAWGCEDKQF